MIFKLLVEEIDAIMARDPAARSRLEVVLCYPGFHAVVLHRVANGLWRHGWRLAGRFVSHIARVATGIEIHPGATIGRRFFVDHGMGTVLGETSEVGDDVTLYQGVTLGGTSLDGGKRHPTLRDGVIVGAGAKILGPLTVHANARVGSNAVVLKDVPEGATVVGIPARVVVREAVPAKEFCAYGSVGDLPDPVARAIDALCADIGTLRARVAQLEGQLASVQEDAAHEIADGPVAMAAGERKVVAIKGENR
jgi:serine O-acetyltransferase